MYRFTNQITNPSLVLVRKQIGDSSCAALIVMRAPQRRYASERPEQPTSRKLLWSALGATLLTGAAVVYSKENPDVRSWLKKNAPFADDFVAFVYQENSSYWKFTTNQFSKVTSSLHDMLFGKEGVTPVEIKSRYEQHSEKPLETKKYSLPPPVLEPLYVKEKQPLEEPQVTQEATLVRTEPCQPESTKPVRVTKDMVELEHEMHENMKLAIENYKVATTSCENYNRALYKIVELSVDDLDRNVFMSLMSSQKDRDNTAKVAKEAATKAKFAIDTLDRLIKSGVEAPPESLVATQRYIKQFRTDLEAAEQAFKLSREKSVLSDKYWNKVEAARKQFREELQMLFPGADLAARRLELRGDMDLLLIYMMKQIQFYQKEIAEMQTVGDLKISRALETMDEKDLVQIKAEDVIRQERLANEREYQLKSLEIQAEANRSLKEQLKKQFELQQEVMQDKLKQKEQEVMNKFSRSVSEQVEKDRVQFKSELAAMAGKLQAIEQMLKQRVKCEAEARRSQSLWAAAEALHAATRRPGVEAKVDNEIKALEKAGKDDKLVQSVVQGIPKTVREKGITTERALRDKFDVVEKTAMKVALVGNRGASLPVYFLSWLQSKLLFQRFAEIPRDELENKPTDFTKLDTHDIIHRARYYIDHGDIPSALRYVNLLQGAPRKAAAAWVEAARSHLEIRQAAEAVMAHASVSGLLNM